MHDIRNNINYAGDPKLIPDIDEFKGRWKVIEARSWTECRR
jgi:hypothetical protein